MKRYQLNLSLTGVIVLIAAGVLFPVMLSTAVGIIAIAVARDAGGIVRGVLMISFAAAAGGSALIAIVLTGRKARLARRQADFVANISHEFRTPLSAIKLYAQTLQSGRLAGDPDRTAQCLTTILRETEWLDLMIDSVLTWRASARDMMLLNMTTKPVSETVTGAVKRFKAMVHPEDMRMSESIDSRLPVRHDPRAIGAVVLNLLTNAYKYGGKDRQIHVSVRDEDRCAAIAVRDNGAGMTPSEMKRVFNPFYRAARPAGNDAGGVGLGLAIARHIVNRHDGAIDIRSEKGQGSTFVVRLPASQDET